MARHLVMKLRLTENDHVEQNQWRPVLFGQQKRKRKFSLTSVRYPAHV